MKKLTALIKGTETTVNLQDSILTTGYEYVFIKRVTVFWEYKNIPRNFTALTVNNKVVNMYSGYYTFKDVQDLLAEHQVTLTRLSHNGHCRLQTNSATTVNLTSHIAKLLGFNDDNRSFDPSSNVISDNVVDVNLSLKYISVHCNLVNNESCFNSKGRRSDIITTLPITTTQSVFGLASNYVDIESKVSIVKGAFNEIKFNVTDQDGNPDANPDGTVYHLKYG